MIFCVDTFLCSWFLLLFVFPSLGSEQVQSSFGDKVLQSESCSMEQESIAKQHAKIVIYINFSTGKSWLITFKSKDFNRRKKENIFCLRIQTATTTLFSFVLFWTPDLVLWTKQTDSEGAALHAVVLYHPNLCVKLNKIWMLNISFHDHLSFCGKCVFISIKKIYIYSKCWWRNVYGMHINIVSLIFFFVCLFCFFFSLCR